MQPHEPATLSPTPEQIRRAAAAAMENPSALMRTFTYALNHLSRELREHPEDEMMARAEASDVSGLLVEIVAALHGLGSKAEVSDEQMHSARFWMLGQIEDPLTPHD